MALFILQRLHGVFIRNFQTVENEHSDDNGDYHKNACQYRTVKYLEEANIGTYRLFFFKHGCRVCVCSLEVVR